MNPSFIAFPIKNLEWRVLTEILRDESRVVISVKMVTLNDMCHYVRFKRSSVSTIRSGYNKKHVATAFLGATPNVL